MEVLEAYGCHADYEEELWGLTKNRYFVTKAILLERVAQTPLVSVSTYDTHDSMSRGSNRNSHARAGDQNLVSANLND